MTLGADLGQLQRVLGSGRVRHVALGWNDDGNEELRLYEDPIDGEPLVRIEALDGLIGLWFERGGTRRGTQRGTQTAQTGRKSEAGEQG